MKTNNGTFDGDVKESFKKAVAVLPEETRKTIAALKYDVEHRASGTRRADMGKTQHRQILACPLGVPMALAASLSGKTVGGFAPGSGASAINQWARVGQITNDQATEIERDDYIDAMTRFIYDWDAGAIPQEDLADLFSVAE